jgi:hypothetical protein
LNVELHSNSILIRIIGNTVESKEESGEAIVLFKFKHQTIPLLVIISLPSLLSIVVHSSSQV